MKALADLKRRQMSTTMDESLPDENFGYHPQSLGRPSRHYLHAVAPLEMPPSSLDDEVEFDRATSDSQRMVATNLVIRPAFYNKAMTERMTTPKLTTEEFIQVRLATVRESTRHCYWPSDVVARFAAADVIR
jgi:hypothetical protein